MTASPQPNLTAAMLSRASDLAHYMLTKGLSVSVASGTAANGCPVTVILAIGEQAEPTRVVGEAMATRVGEARNAAADRAKRN